MPRTDRPETLDNLFIIRPAGEVWTKKRHTRNEFLKALKKNVNDGVRREGHYCKISIEINRLLMKTDGKQAIIGMLARMFGVGSFTIVDKITDSSMESILQVGEELYKERVRGRTFAVRAKRLAGLPYTTPEIERNLGARLGLYAKVNLGNPEITVHVEAYKDKAYLFTERYSGAGGLPTGVQGRAIVLLSGGFDSAVAAWRMMRRGVQVDFVLCNLGGSAYERLVLQIAKFLYEAWGYGQRPYLHVVDFASVLGELRNNAKSSYWQVLLKRVMYRVATKIAQEREADAIVTGEALGQVSSQTISNLNVIAEATQIQVLRPLIGFDKQEIINEAQKIGTAILSEKVKEYCAITPGKPAVVGRLDRVIAEEQNCDFSRLDSDVVSRKKINLRQVSADDLRTPYLFTEVIPDNAVLIDCQQDHMYRAWHAPNARHLEATQLFRQFNSLDKDATYVLYCTYGTQTPHAAEVMQQMGFEAYAFKGGISAVKRYFLNSSTTL